MKRLLLLLTVFAWFAAPAVQAQSGPAYSGHVQPGHVQPGQAAIGQPGVEYAHTIAAGEGGQLFPYDRQDPWLHGQYQRIPAYGGFASFRPYNYRHVFAQTQIATTWGMPRGLPYSQQFWNRYREDYLHGHLHSQAAAVPAAQTVMPEPVMPESDSRPIHVYPASARRR